VRLEQYAKRRIDQLSGGQQQRVALARALAIEPGILLLDEPLSNLDARLREELRDELSGLQRRLGMTTLYVTHDQSEALAMSDRVAVLEHGLCRQLGRPEEIYNRPANAFVARFIGNTNLIPCHIRSLTNGRAAVNLLGAETSARVSGTLDKSTATFACVRPEAFELAADAQFEAVLTEVVFNGSTVSLAMRCRGEELRAIVFNDPRRDGLEKGKPVRFRLPEHGIILVQ
jgi:iron(III) transport system ATP-binding protein